MIHFLVLGGYLISLITAGSGFFIQFKNPRITNFNQRTVNSNYFFLKFYLKEPHGFHEKPGIFFDGYFNFSKKLKTIITNLKTRHVIFLRISVTLRTSLIFDRQFGVIFNTQPKVRVHFKGTPIV